MRKYSFTVYLDLPDYKELKKLARKEKKSMASLIREALKEKLWSIS